MKELFEDPRQDEPSNDPAPASLVKFRQISQDALKGAGEAVHQVVKLGEGDCMKITVCRVEKRGGRGHAHKQAAWETGAYPQTQDSAYDPEPEGALNAEIQSLHCERDLRQHTQQQKQQHRKAVDHLVHSSRTSPSTTRKMQRAREGSKPAASPRGFASREHMASRASVSFPTR